MTRHGVGINDRDKGEIDRISENKHTNCPALQKEYKVLARRLKLSRFSLLRSWGFADIQYLF